MPHWKVAHLQSYELRKLLCWKKHILLGAEFASVNQIINILISNYNMKSVRHTTEWKMLVFLRLSQAELCSSIWMTQKANFPPASTRIAWKIAGICIVKGYIEAERFSV